MFTHREDVDFYLVGLLGHLYFVSLRSRLDYWRGSSGLGSPVLRGARGPEGRCPLIGHLVRARLYFPA